MVKELSRSAAVAAKTLYAILCEIQKKGGSMPAKDIWSFAESNVSFNEWEATRAGKYQWERWRASTQFYSIVYKKAGFIVKKGGIWYLTPEGEIVLKHGAEAVFRKAYLASYENNKEGKTERRETVLNDEEIDEEVAKDLSINIEELEGRAFDGIQQYIRSKGPYDFQYMVAALLRAMGYYTPFIAPKGKDGGIDVIAYLDPLGVKEPRIKVQVKHMPDTAISSKDIQALVGALRPGDIGLFITSGYFSSDARTVSRNSREFIRILDGKEFIEMWIEYYDKMSDEDKNMLPLKRIAFLGNNE